MRGKGTRLITKKSRKIQDFHDFRDSGFLLSGFLRLGKVRGAQKSFNDKSLSGATTFRIMRLNIITLSIMAFGITINKR